MAINYKGDWFLPNSSVKLPGELFVDYVKKQITLTLYCNLYLNGDKISTLNFNSEISKFYEVILGHQLYNSQEISLLNCIINKIEKVGEELYKLIYKVDFAIFNAHFDKISDLIIYKAHIDFPFLASIFEGKYYLDDIDEIEPKAISDIFKINDNLGFKLNNQIIKDFSNNDYKYSKQYKKTIEFEFTKGEHFEKMLEAVLIFKSLIEFVTSKPIVYKIISLYIQNKTCQPTIINFSNQNNFSLLNIYNFAQNNSYKIHDNILHQNGMMFSAWQFEPNEINEIVKKWFENDNLYTIYSLYNDSNNWFEGTNILLSNVMYNNRFLNLIQALESFYKKKSLQFRLSNEDFTKKRQQVLNCISDQCLKNWARKHFKYPKEINLIDILKNIVDEFKEILEYLELIDFSNIYPYNCKEYRNDLSHGINDDVYLGVAFEKSFSFSKLLLCFCILDSLEINKSKIKNIFETNFKMQEEIRNVKFNK